MKWKISICMECFFALLITASLSGCNDSPGNDLDKTAIEPVPVSVPLSPLAQAIRSAIIDIETKEITMAGASITRLDIEGTEVIRSSKKEYYQDEMRSQETDFNNYLQYLDKVSKNRNIADPLKRQQSQEKHNAVMAYLEKMTRTASAKQDIYKVVYHLKADTKTNRYDQRKTTYLDKDLKKITGDYGFLGG